MKQKQKRQNYTKEFKLEAVRLAENSDRPKKKVAEELGISDLLLCGG
ncbi:MAG: transposase [Deltaproteobacteria bacterium]|nr:transposase [Deltaproteobacteria bacterium]